MMTSSPRIQTSAEDTRQLCEAHHFSPEGFVNVKQLEKREEVLAQSPLLRGLTAKTHSEDKNALVPQSAKPHLDKEAS